MKKKTEKQWKKIIETWRRDAERRTKKIDQMTRKALGPAHEERGGR